MLAPDEIESRLRPVLTQQADIVAAWLFGSAASGGATALSDVDVAVLYGQSRGLLEHGHLTAQIMSALGTNDVDLVDLARATPFLQHRVLSRGRLLFQRDAVARVRFTAAALSRYFDLIPFLRRAYAH